MADIKNFGLAGVGTNVQFGKGGAKLVQASNAFSFRKNDNSGFTNVKVAFPVVADDATTKQYVDGLIGALDATQIQSTDGLTKVDTDLVTGAVTVDAKAGTGTSRVAEFHSGTGANSYLSFSNATLNEVTFTAAGTSDDVDLHLLAKGDGVVRVGAEGESGNIQADAGMNLVLSGGGDLDGAGGSLILRAGHGATDNGQLLLQTGDGQTVITVKGAAGQTAGLVAEAGTTAVTLSAAGSEDNIDIKLKTKGTGKIDAGVAIISSVVDPVAAQDAATKNYVDTVASNINNQVQTNLIGSLQTREITISTATMDVGAMIKGRVRRVMLKINTGYSAGAQLTIGTASSPDELVTNDAIDESTIGIYDLNTAVNYTTATQLRAFVTGGPSVGSATLVVEYIQG